MVQEQRETKFAVLELSDGAILEDLEQKTLDTRVLAPVEIDQSRLPQTQSIISLNL